MRRVKEIIIAGKKVELSERSAKSVLDLISLSRSKGKDLQAGIIGMSIMINQALQYWIDKRLFSFYWSWKFSARKLLKKLTIKEMSEFVDIINDLEGNKKKVTPAVENQSDEQRQGD